MIWFTSDTHFGHENILAFDPRPFETVEEMGITIIRNINAVVQPSDTLWHLGDWCMGVGTNKVKVSARYRSMIACQNVHLVRGNHDPTFEPAFDALFESVHGLYELRRAKHSNPVVLCHYPIHSWNKKSKGAYHLHGHCHGAVKDKELRRLDVGVTEWSYSPVSLDYVVQLLSVRPLPQTDHHGRNTM